MLLSGCISVPQFYALEREVAELKDQRESGGVADNERTAELGSQVDALSDEVARLRGAVEEARHLAQRALEQAQHAQQGAGTAAGSPASGVTATVDPQSLSGEIRAYEEAFAVYRAGEYEAAIDRFDAFLQTHPSSEHSDNALFWKGECYFKLEDYEQAVLTFEDVVNRYPDGNKVPDALYRQGIALLELGKRSREQETYGAAARQIFGRIVNDYPQSERLGEARRQLEKLGP